MLSNKLTYRLHSELKLQWKILHLKFELNYIYISYLNDISFYKEKRFQVETVCLAYNVIKYILWVI